MTNLDQQALELATAPTEARAERAQVLRDEAAGHGVHASSIAPIYRAFSVGELEPMTIPAMNLRGLTYEAARAAWRAALDLDAGPILFELAPSEASVTDQPFCEYAAMVLAAAAREGYRGPVFLQGDHFDIPDASPNSLERLGQLGREAIDAGIRQIDVDAAALARDASDPQARQVANARATAAALLLLRDHGGNDLVVGGEVGEIGGQNTDPDDLRAFLSQVAEAVPRGTVGLGKVSVQTGTRHGGVVTPEGDTGVMPLDVRLVAELARIARDEFGLPGVVQHGASTLTLEQLAQLPGAGVIEVHLATGIQNLVLDHPALPDALVERMKRELVGPVEHAEGGQHETAATPEQRYYQNRWQAWGRFKNDLWGLPQNTRQDIGGTLEMWFRDLFTALGVAGRRGSLERVKR